MSMRIKVRQVRSLLFRSLDRLFSKHCPQKNRRDLWGSPLAKDQKKYLTSSPILCRLEKIESFAFQKHRQSAHSNCVHVDAPKFGILKWPPFLSSPSYNDGSRGHQMPWAFLDLDASQTCPISR